MDTTSTGGKGGGGETTLGLLESSGEELVTLVRSELALARNELREDVARTSAVLPMLGVAVALGAAGAGVVVGAIVAAGRKHPTLLAALGAALLGGAGVLGSAAVAELPSPLRRTRERIRDDAERVEEALR